MERGAVISDAAFDAADPNAQAICSAVFCPINVLGDGLHISPTAIVSPISKSGLLFFNTLFNENDAVMKAGIV
jgi:hypothetical protein